MKKNAIQRKEAQPAVVGKLSDAKLDDVTGGVRHSQIDQSEQGQFELDSAAKGKKAASNLLKKFSQTSDLITGNMK